MINLTYNIDNQRFRIIELGMVTETRPLQPENAPLLIDVTKLGMVTEVKPLQEQNA